MEWKSAIFHADFFLFFLFANTLLGVKASAAVYNLIETATENDLDPYRYLLWILEQASKLAVNDENWAKQLTPDNYLAYAMH